MGAALCMGGCLAASLAPTHYMPLAPLSWLWQSKTFPDIANSLPGDRITRGGEPLVQRKLRCPHWAWPVTAFFRRRLTQYPLRPGDECGNLSGSFQIFWCLGLTPKILIDRGMAGASGYVEVLRCFWLSSKGETTALVGHGINLLKYFFASI